MNPWSSASIASAALDSSAFAAASLSTATLASAALTASAITTTSLTAASRPPLPPGSVTRKGDPLAPASVRLTPGPRNGAHHELPPPSPPLPPPPSPPPTAFAAPPPHHPATLALTPPPPQPPPSLLCPPDRRRCRRCRISQLHARARAAASPRARVRALASSRALSAPHSTAQHSASSMRELARELYCRKRQPFAQRAQNELECIDDVFMCVCTCALPAAALDYALCTVSCELLEQLV